MTRGPIDFHPMYGFVLVIVGGAFVLSLTATYVVRAWARRVGFVDQPGGHKRHKSPIALGGGTAIAVSVCMPLLAGTLAAWWYKDAGSPAWLPSMLHAHLPGIASKLPVVIVLVACTLVLHIVGLIDDRKALGPVPKLCVQLVVAVLIAWPMGIRVAEALPAPISVILTVLWIVVVTNAFNFLDNMDGLSAGVAVIAASVFAIAAMNVGQIFVPMLAWLLVGVLAGFLVFNFSPATIFMGDAGSLVVGFWMSVLTILTTYYDPTQRTTPMGLFVPFVVLAVPLYDVISVVVLRLRAGTSPFRGDGRHFSHRLVKRGMAPRGAVLTIYLATAATALPAILLPNAGWNTAILLLLECCCVVLMIAILEHAGTISETRP